jgi:IS30 family transposase
MPYKHFTEKEIYAIEIYKNEWYNNYKISKKLYKSHTSINRIINKYKNPKTWIFNAKYCINEKKKLIQIEKIEIE